MTATEALTLALLALTLLWVYTITYALHYAATLRKRILAQLLPEAANILANQASQHGRHTNN